MVFGAEVIVVTLLQPLLPFNWCKGPFVQPWLSPGLLEHNWWEGPDVLQRVARDCYMIAFFVDWQALATTPKMHSGNNGQADQWIYQIVSQNTSCQSRTTIRKYVKILRNMVTFKLPWRQPDTENLIAPMQFLVSQGNQAYGVLKAWLKIPCNILKKDGQRTTAP